MRPVAQRKRAAKRRAGRTKRVAWTGQVRLRPWFAPDSFPPSPQTQWRDHPHGLSTSRSVAPNSQAGPSWTGELPAPQTPPTGLLRCRCVERLTRGPRTPSWRNQFQYLQTVDQLCRYWRELLGLSGAQMLYASRVLCRAPRLSRRNWSRSLNLVIQRVRIQVDLRLGVFEMRVKGAGLVPGGRD
jgi:hypothetical protein